MRIYVASSWRNEHQPSVVKTLRAAGHEVYDFCNPPERKGFAWFDIDPAWQSWTVPEYIEALAHPLAIAGFKSDMDALKWCEACVYVLPCGRSASLELGWAVGAGKLTIALLDDAEPELMIKMVDHVCVDLGEVIAVLRAEEEKKEERARVWEKRPIHKLHKARHGKDYFHCDPDKWAGSGTEFWEHVTCLDCIRKYTRRDELLRWQEHQAKEEDR